MAEGWARYLGINCASAGTHPATQVATNAVKVMAEKGIDISEQIPNRVDDFHDDDFDLIFSMGCGVSCPNLPLAGDWQLEDPVGQSLEVYRETRDRIEKKIRELLA
jgi:arsenate reductase